MSVTMLSVVMLSATVLSVTILSVVMLSVTILSVVAPKEALYMFYHCHPLSNLYLCKYVFKMHFQNLLLP